MRLIVTGFILSLTVTLLFLSCNKRVSPRPRGYFRIDFPEKEYQRFVSGCGYSFEYPVYGEIDTVYSGNNNPCWYNIFFPKYKCTIYLTYKKLDKKDIAGATEDLRTFAYKHVGKADDIVETSFERKENNVYGIIYDIKGNTASNLNFYITDDSSHFLSGALYFAVHPNKDSLAPVITFFRQDILHLLESFRWN